MAGYTFDYSVTTFSQARRPNFNRTATASRVIAQ